MSLAVCGQLHLQMAKKKEAAASCQIHPLQSIVQGDDPEFTVDPRIRVWTEGTQ